MSKAPFSIVRLLGEGLYPCFVWVGVWWEAPGEVTAPHNSRPWAQFPHSFPGCALQTRLGTDVRRLPYVLPRSLSLSQMVYSSQVFQPPPRLIKNCKPHIPGHDLCSVWPDTLNVETCFHLIFKKVGFGYKCNNCGQGTCLALWGHEDKSHTDSTPNSLLEKRKLSTEGQC